MKKIIPSIVLSLFSYPIAVGINWVNSLFSSSYAAIDYMLPCLVIAVNTISIILALYFLLHKKAD